MNMSGSIVAGMTVIGGVALLIGCSGGPQSGTSPITQLPIGTQESQRAVTPDLAKNLNPTPGSYPAAGWIPYTTANPFILTVAKVYGSNPLSTCNFQTTYGGIQGTGCLMQKSAAVISNIAANNNTFFGIDVRVSTSAQAEQIVDNAQGYYSKLSDSGATPFFVAYGNSNEYTAQVLNGGCQFNLEGTLSPQPQTVRMPPGIVPQLNPDRHVLIRDKTTHKDWTFILSGSPSQSNVLQNGGYYPLGTLDGGWNCPKTGWNGAGAVVSTTKPTVPGAASEVDYTTSKGLNISGTAGKMSLLWQVRPEDVLVGHIDHALIYSSSCDTHNIYYPATANDNSQFCGNDTINPDYGGHLWSDTAPNPSLWQNGAGSPGCDIYAYTVLRELNEYGAYLNDVGGGNNNPPFMGVQSTADLTDDYSGNPYPPKGASPWLQVLQKMVAVGDKYINTNPNNRVQYGIPVGSCGIQWSNFHYLVPPPVVP